MIHGQARRKPYYMEIVEWVIWFLENFGVLLSIFGAIVGAILGVIVSQALRLYRSDRETVDRFQGILRRIEIAIAEGQSTGLRDDRIDSIDQDFRDVYTGCWWLFTQEGDDLINEFLKNISKPRRRAPDDPDVYIIPDEESGQSSLTAYLEEFVEEIEEHRHPVTLRGAWRRYRGKSNPYDSNR